MARGSEILIIARMRDEASRVSKDLASNIERHAGQIRKAGLIMAAAGAAITAGLIMAAKSALDEERGIARLDVVLKSIGKTYAEVSKELEKQIRVTQLTTSFGDELQREILARLIPAMGNYKDALAALPLILDTVAFSGKSYQTVVETLGRALAGQITTVTSLGISFDKTATTAERMAIVQQLIGGMAEAMVDPFVQLSNAVGDLAQALASPLLEPLVKFLANMSELALKLADTNPELLKFVSFAVVGAAAFLTLAGTLALLLPTLAKTAVLLFGAGGAAGLIGGIALMGKAGLVGLVGGIAYLGATAIFKQLFPSWYAKPGMSWEGTETQKMALTIQGGPFILSDEKDMALFADIIADALRRRQRGEGG